MNNTTIKHLRPLGFPWQTQDPFLFCAFHEDFYPKGNGELGPDASLEGRSLGNDFTIKDGWRMYHGQKVPGFPSHPHRGFETITVVNKGLVDHADSMGAAGRFGNGDVQWMTAGKGVQHSEMFPVLNEENENPLEMFQIWLNLPKAKKLVEPHFKMLWNDSIPYIKGDGYSIQVVAGNFDGISAPDPNPESWASDPANKVGVLYMKIKAGSSWTLPADDADVSRSMFFFDGKNVFLNGEEIDQHLTIELFGDREVEIKAGEEDLRILFLQGKPIDEPVAQYGPFVMNTQMEIQETFMEYQRTQFGGWPWESSDPTHGKDTGRFAKYADGKVEEPS